MPTLHRVGAGLMCLLLASVPSQAQEMTDAQLIELIIRDGAQARAIRSSVDVTRREQSARTVAPNPRVAYSREGAGFTEFVSVEQPLAIFGVRAALRQAGASATAAAEAERDAALWQLRADAQAIVARLLAEQETLQASQQTVRDVGRMLVQLRVREKEGEGSRFDRLRAEQELAEAQQIELDTAASAAHARASIAAVVSDGARVTRVTGTLYRGQPVPPLESLEIRAAASRRELEGLASAAERFRLEADAARRARRPAPTVVAGVKRADGDAGREAGGLLGVSLTVPLFDSGRREAERWLAEGDRVAAERAFLAQSIRAQVASAFEILVLRQDAVRAAETASPADELSRIAEVAYTEGEAGILELLDAYRTAARARLRAIDMRLAARLAQIALERAVGDSIWP